MLRKLSFALSMLFILSMVLSACAPTATPTSPPAPAATEAPQMQQPSGQGEIVQRVRDRGKVVCGGRTDLAGFGFLDADGNNVGFDVDLCRAVAAAVLGDPNAVEIVNLTAADRGPALQTGEVDILSRNTTWTSTRDAQSCSTTAKASWSARTAGSPPSSS